MRPLNGENPIDYANRVASFDNADFPLVTFKIHYNLSTTEAKVLWLSSPAFQERFSRSEIAGRKSRGGSDYGGKNWLKRRYKLSGSDLDVIFADFWSKPKNQPSQVFLEKITRKRIAEVQLTEHAQEILKGLSLRYPDFRS